ncbi:hypothetical protein [Flagellimonas okinawensis]|uniref:Uncharacterized protein n=1 Tax=Flagellimonas okinawensis TaxID=3031324 RepID=A0ABT5XL40_9FLAO|nr:hypothetical protein [[Muricauda] okinawensis]MDF0706612.1 hypothetical protein [[Muricauda] okinawensis]
MNQGYSNNVDYKFISKTLGKVSIPEPINYDDGIRNIYERDGNSKGFLKTKSNNLEFYNEGREYLIRQYASKGVTEDLILQRNIKSKYRLDERWRTISETYLNLGELSFNRNTAKVKATEGGLYKVIDSKKSDEFDLVDNTASNGKILPDLNRTTVQVDGRDILRISKMEVEDGTRVNHPVSGGDTTEAKTVPFNIYENSDKVDLQSVFEYRWGIANDTWANFIGGDLFAGFLVSGADFDTVLKLNGRIELQMVDTPWPGTLRLDILRYRDDGNGGFEKKEVIPLDSISTALLNTASFDFNNYPLEVQQGDYITFGVFSDTLDGIKYEYYNTTLEIREDSTFPASAMNCLTYKTLGERLVAKITGQSNAFYCSEMEDNGIWEGHLVTNGFWARNFPDVIQEGTDEERKIQFTTSLEDFLKHLYAIRPIAWWVEKVGNKERMRVELLTYTQQNFIGIKYAEVSEDEYGKRTTTYLQPSSDLERKTLKDNFYKSITLGSDKGGDNYEEVAGLQSISGKASWSTVNNKSESVYEYLSPYRLGDVDIELARRKPFSEFPDEDTQYDSDLLVVDCYKSGTGYYIKKWQHYDFEEEPKNIYKVGTAFNLEFTPARFLLNHSSEINVGLYHYPLEYIYFNSSNCNSSFESKRENEALLREDAPIPHSRLDKPRIRPISVDFDLEVSDELEEIITGQTKGVPNWFGMVAVDTGDGIEYFRLVKVDANKEGKHKLVEVNNI